MYIKVDPDATSKNVSIDVKANTFTFKYAGQLIKQGTFFQEVLPDDCNWQFDGKGDERKVWLTLTKKFVTKGNQHWKYVFEGDPGLDMSQMGTPIHTIDPSTMDKAAMRKQMEEVGSFVVRGCGIAIYIDHCLYC